MKEFEIKILGRHKNFFWIEVLLQTKHMLSQRKNVLDLLKETQKLGCK